MAQLTLYVCCRPLWSSRSSRRWPASTVSASCTATSWWRRLRARHTSSVTMLTGLPRASSLASSSHRTVCRNTQRAWRAGCSSVGRLRWAVLFRCASLPTDHDWGRQFVICGSLRGSMRPLTVTTRWLCLYQCSLCKGSCPPLPHHATSATRWFLQVLSEGITCKRKPWIALHIF